MNCPSRKDTEPELDDGYNQSPNALSADLTTRSDLSRIASARLHQDHRIADTNEVSPEFEVQESGPTRHKHEPFAKDHAVTSGAKEAIDDMDKQQPAVTAKEEGLPSGGRSVDRHGQPSRLPSWLQRSKTALVRFPKFIGPGFMISVAYIDPGNYATDIAAGASYRFRLLFIILMANIFAIYLQSLCIKLGSVTGMNLSEMCRAHLPRWLNYALYFFAEAAIIATDIAEVIGTAIALNLLLSVPLVAGCALSIVAVLVILLFYRPNSGSLTLRSFEFVIGLLVIGVVICFCFQLSLITNTRVGDVFRGYLPSSVITEGRALYQACGILGATVMPHSLFLGSGMVQPRLREFDEANNTLRALDDDEEVSSSTKYRPSLSAIKACMSYSIAELAIALFTFALFVNSSILIVAGASLYGIPDSSDADLFGIYKLLRTSLAPAAGTVFALALLLSGVTAMIVCTIAGQMVCEGHLNLKLKPWVRALMTRSLSIVPAIIIAGAVGKDGLSAALEGSQVALSIILPFISAPLIWFTCRAKYMMASDNALTAANSNGVHSSHNSDGEPVSRISVNMRNNWLTAGLAIVIWLIIVVMNVALLVLAGLGDH